MKYSIQPGATNRTNVDLSHNHITTLDFNQILPIQSTDCIIGDKHHVEISPFIRLAPLAVPTFGNFNLRLVTFFVPYYQVFKHFDSFMSGIDFVGSTNTQVLPRINMTKLYAELTKLPDCKSVSNPSSEDAYDIAFVHKVTNGIQDIKYYKLGTTSKYIYKTLCILGYPCNSFDNTVNATYLNALPLLCFLKGFNDWMTLSANYNNSILTNFIENPYYDSGSGYLFREVNASVLMSILNTYLHPLIGSDYFTNAYNFALSSTDATPYKSVDEGFFNRLRDNKTDNISSVNSTKDYTYIQIGEENFELPQYRLKFLQSIDRFIRRNQLAGTKAAQRIYATFGLKSQDFRSNYATIVNQTSIPFQVGDVTATAANADPALGLGTYAGQSVASGKYSFDFECPDFGFLFTIGFVDVKAQYRTAIPATNLKTHYLDFYQPDFDGVGLMPISRSQLFTNPKAETFAGINSVRPSNVNQVFGFVPRYEEYRQEFDKVSGDFNLFSTMDSWHFARNFDQTFKTIGVLPQSHQFQFIGTEFDRIFTSDITDSATIYDHFFSVFHIEHHSVRPIKSRAGSLDLPDGQITLQSLGNTVSEM